LRRISKAVLPYHDVLILWFGGQFYDQIDGIAMGSPLSPVVASFFMEDFKEMALDQAAHKPMYWFRFMDNTFVMRPHGPDRLRDFPDHLSSISQNIQFTMEMERDIYRRPDGSLGHKVYRKPTHTNLYPNSSSHHHPTSVQL
jgi:hypothetical protein